MPWQDISQYTSAQNHIFFHKFPAILLKVSKARRPNSFKQESFHSIQILAQTWKWVKLLFINFFNRENQGKKKLKISLHDFAGIVPSLLQVFQIGKTRHVISSKRSKENKLDWLIRMVMRNSCPCTSKGDILQKIDQLLLLLLQPLPSSGNMRYIPNYMCPNKVIIKHLIN